jgi:N-methylhydantoinase A
LNETRIVSLDIGGTTAKCALINELRAPVTTEYSIEKTPTTAGYPIKTPVIELVEIGSGGGSIARIDEGGKLHVGPESAGAVPGPAVFGRGGTLPTTTDAQVLTRRLDPNNLLGGEIAPDLESCERAFEPLAKQLDLSLGEVARGVLRVANANMAGALRLVSVNKGYDPRDFTLVAFGGGGALHAAALGEALSFRKVIVPLGASVFSAWGMLVTDLRRDYLRTRITTLGKDESAAIHEAFEALADEARADFENAAVILERHADLRYRGQEHTVKIPFPELAPGAELVRVALEGFHTAHERAYSYRLDRTVELVNLHLVARVKVESAKLSELPRTGRSLSDARRSRRNVDFDELGSHEASIYDRALLEPEMAIQGPAVIEEPASTCVVPPGLTAVVDTYGNLHIAIGAA